MCSTPPEAEPRPAGYSSLSVCLSVISEFPHLAAMALRLQPQQNKLLVLKVADVNLKASLSNKSYQKLRSLLAHVGRAS